MAVLLADRVACFLETAMLLDNPGGCKMTNNDNNNSPTPSQQSSPPPPPLLVPRGDIGRRLGAAMRQLLHHVTHHPHGHGHGHGHGLGGVDPNLLHLSHPGELTLDEETCAQVQSRFSIWLPPSPRGDPPPTTSRCSEGGEILVDVSELCRRVALLVCRTSEMDVLATTVARRSNVHRRRGIVNSKVHAPPPHDSGSGSGSIAVMTDEERRRTLIDQQSVERMRNNNSRRRQDDHYSDFVIKSFDYQQSLAATHLQQKLMRMFRRWIAVERRRVALTALRVPKLREEGNAFSRVVASARIQSLARGVKARQHLRALAESRRLEEAKLAAVAAIQSFLRAAWWRFLSRLVTVATADFRRFVGRAKYLRMKAAAPQVHKAARGFIARRRVVNWTTAVHGIQRVWHGYIGRKRYRLIAYQAWAFPFARTIQAGARGFFGGKLSKQQNAIRAESEERLAWLETRRKKLGRSGFEETARGATDQALFVHFIKQNYAKAGRLYKHALMVSDTPPDAALLIGYSIFLITGSQTEAGMDSRGSSRGGGSRGRSRGGIISAPAGVERGDDAFPPGGTTALRPRTEGGNVVNAGDEEQQQQVVAFINNSRPTSPAMTDASMMSSRHSAAAERRATTQARLEKQREIMTEVIQRLSEAMARNDFTERARWVREIFAVHAVKTKTDDPEALLNYAVLSDVVLQQPFRAQKLYLLAAYHSNNRRNSVERGGTGTAFGHAARAAMYDAGITSDRRLKDCYSRFQGLNRFAWGANGVQDWLSNEVFADNRVVSGVSCHITVKECGRALWIQAEALPDAQAEARRIRAERRRNEKQKKKHKSRRKLVAGKASASSQENTDDVGTPQLPVYELFLAWRQIHDAMEATDRWSLLFCDERLRPHLLNAVVDMLALVRSERPAMVAKGEEPPKELAVMWRPSVYHEVECTPPSFARAGGKSQQKLHVSVFVNKLESRVVDVVGVSKTLMPAKAKTTATTAEESFSRPSTAASSASNNDDIGVEEAADAIPCGLVFHAADAQGNALVPMFVPPATIESLMAHKHEVIKTWRLSQGHLPSRELVESLCYMLDVGAASRDSKNDISALYDQDSHYVMFADGGDMEQARAATKLLPAGSAKQAAFRKAKLALTMPKETLYRGRCQKFLDAVAVQRVFRGHLGRRAFAHNKRSAVLPWIQKHVRGAMERVAMAKFCSAVVLQAWARARSTRMRVSAELLRLFPWCEGDWRHVATSIQLQRRSAWQFYTKPNAHTRAQLAIVLHAWEHRYSQACHHYEKGLLENPNSPILLFGYCILIRAIHPIRSGASRQKFWRLLMHARRQDPHQRRFTYYGRAYFSRCALLRPFSEKALVNHALVLWLVHNDTESALDILLTARTVVRHQFRNSPTITRLVEDIRREQEEQEKAALYVQRFWASFKAKNSMFNAMNHLLVLRKNEERYLKNPEDADILLTHALGTHFQQHRLADARPLYEKIFLLDPTNPAAYLGFAMLLLVERTKAVVAAQANGRRERLLKSVHASCGDGDDDDERTECPSPAVAEKQQQQSKAAAMAFFELPLGTVDDDEVNETETPSSPKDGGGDPADKREKRPSKIVFPSEVAVDLVDFFGEEESSNFSAVCSAARKLVDHVAQWHIDAHVAHVEEMQNEILFSPPFSMRILRYLDNQTKFRARELCHTWRRSIDRHSSSGDGPGFKTLRLDGLPWSALEHIKLAQQVETTAAQNRRGSAYTDALIRIETSFIKAAMKQPSDLSGRSKAISNRGLWEQWVRRDFRKAHWYLALACTTNPTDRVAMVVYIGFVTMGFASFLTDKEQERVDTLQARRVAAKLKREHIMRMNIHAQKERTRQDRLRKDDDLRRQHSAQDRHLKRLAEEQRKKDDDDKLAMAAMKRQMASQTKGGAAKVAQDRRRQKQAAARQKREALEKKMRAEAALEKAKEEAERKARLERADKMEADRRERELRKITAEKESLRCWWAKMEHSAHPWLARLACNAADELLSGPHGEHSLVGDSIKAKVLPVDHWRQERAGEAARPEAHDEGFASPFIKSIRMKVSSRREAPPPERVKEAADKTDPEWSATEAAAGPDGTGAEVEPNPCWHEVLCHELIDELLHRASEVRFNVLSEELKHHRHLQKTPKDTNKHEEAPPIPLKTPPRGRKLGSSLQSLLTANRRGSTLSHFHMPSIHLHKAHQGSQGVKDIHFKHTRAFHLFDRGVLEAPPLKWQCMLCLWSFLNREDCHAALLVCRAWCDPAKHGATRKRGAIAHLPQIHLPVHKHTSAKLGQKSVPFVRRGGKRKPMPSSAARRDEVARSSGETNSERRTRHVERLRRLLLGCAARKRTGSNKSV